MCGICGIFNLDGRPVTTPLIKQMTDSLSHRGPDGEGCWVDSFIGLGHRRLAVIDLSDLAHQPMQAGHHMISYNGEVYNYQNLRAELESLGHAFVSRSDTEVVLKAYAQWGENCLGRFNGMFAFAIWDARTKRLFLARDRYGMKPLYYYHKGATLVFASEIKAILKHPEVRAGLNKSALSEYFTFQNIFSDQTFFKDIRLLPAGHYLTIEPGRQPAIRQYWDYAFCDQAIDEAEALEELDRLFEQAVQRQLVGDVELGAYLSGGIDSGSITCLAASSFKNLKSFTCGFDLSSASGLELSFDERAKAEFLSNRYKTEHYEVVLKAGDMERVMHDLIWHLEDPRVGQCYPNYYVARLASKFVKVVLTGTGGDELFAGYPWRYYGPSQCVSTQDYATSYYQYWQRLIPDDLKAGFFTPETYRAVKTNPAQEAFAKVLSNHELKDCRPQDLVNLSLYFEIKTFLHGLLLVEDKLSMAHGLETRAPFLDNDLVDFAMRLPVGLNLRNLDKIERINENEPGKASKFYARTNDGKLLLRQALARYVPQDYAGSVKQGFSAPDASWFKGESIDYIKDLLFNPRARIYDYIQPRTAQFLMNEHFEGRVNHRLLIWSLLCFEWWNRIFDPA